MKKRFLVLSLVLSLLLAGCGQSLESNRAKWEASGIKNYRMKVAIQKPGHGTPMGTYLITVADGKAVEILSGPPTNAGEPVEPKGLVTDREYPINYNRYDTIEDYFGLVDQAGGLIGNFSLNVRYDPKYGYPKYMHFEGSGVDGGLKLEVLEFTNLS